MGKADPAALATLLPYYREAERVRALWMQPKAFARVLGTALLERSAAAPGTELKACAAYFSDYTVVVLVDTVERFATLLDLLGDNAARQALFDLVTGHELVCLSLLSAIVANERLVAATSSAWRETALKLNARHLIGVAPSASLQVRQLIPEGWEVSDHIKAYVLGWAYEEDKLGPEGVDYFQHAYPGKYGMLANIKAQKN